MKVLMISQDRGILQDGSDVQKRMAEYGALVDELHIIVFAQRIRNQESGIRNKKIAENVWIYSTNSFNRWFYIYDACCVARSIFFTNYKLQNTGLLVTTQDPFETGLAGWLVARKFNLPVQLQIHTDFLSPYFARESLLNKIRVRIAKFLIPRARSIRAVSARIENSLHSTFRTLHSNVSVLPIFIDVRKIKDTPITVDLHKKYPQFEFIALMASRFTKEKNIAMAINAMAEVVKKHPKTGLIIVGSGSEFENYKLLATRQRRGSPWAARYSLLSHVIFESWSDDLSSYYKTADVFMLTSNYEGYGRTVVEAESAGLPVIMTDVGVAGDSIKNGENGLIVPIGDAQALVNAVLSVIEQRVVLHASLPLQPTKDEYLSAYKKTWEQCAS